MIIQPHEPRIIRSRRPPLACSPFGFPGRGGAAALQPPRVAAGGGGGFDPATLSLTGWWRASYGGSPWSPTASAGSSGSNGNLTEATNAPSVGSAVNGLTPGDGDGSNDQLANANNIATFLSDAAATIVALIWADTAAADSGAGAYFNNPAIVSDGGTFQLGFTDSGVRLGYYDGVDHDSVAKACGTGAWHMAWGRWNSTTASVGVDGSAGAATLARGAASLGATPLVAFTNFNASAFFDGKILELITLDSALSDTNIDNLKSYCNARYALSL